MLVSSPYNDGSNIYTLAGDESGNVFKMDIGNTDNGQPISYSLIHPFDSLDGLSSTVKTITKVFFNHSGMTGTNISYRNTDDILNDFRKPIGQLKSGYTGFAAINLKGRKLQIRLSGSSKGEPITYMGYEVVAGTKQLVNFAD